MEVTCTLCGESRPAAKVSVRSGQRICEECVWRLVADLESRGSVRPGSPPSQRSAPCTLCGEGREQCISLGSVRVCDACSQAVAHLVLSSSRLQLEDIWKVELPENTSVRQVSEALAVELKQGGRTHAQLAIDLAAAGDLGQALTEAAIAIVSDPQDRAVVAMALRVLIHGGLTSLLAADDVVNELRQRMTATAPKPSPSG